MSGRSPAGDTETAGRSPLLFPTEFAQIAGWGEDDHAAALACFRISARRMAERPYTTKALGVDARALAAAGVKALALGEVGARAARAFFEEHFRPHRICPPAGSGFVTGYFEPVLAASPVRTARFAWPLYRRPADLVGIDDATRPPSLDPSFMFARRTAAGLEEYFDRAAIEAGALAGRSLELAWLENPIDAFFIHIQGSARLIMPDGALWRISYAGKSGHPFTPIGAILIEMGELRREDVTMDTIRSWLEADLPRARALMARNRSFIFFQRMEQDDPSLGPVAAASVPLTPGRSLAVDHRLQTFGAPVWVSTHAPLPHERLPFCRLMIAQDTGSAIVGPARGDLFIGSGREAGTIAGSIRHPADFIVLAPEPRA